MRKILKYASWAVWIITFLTRASRNLSTQKTRESSPQKAKKAPSDDDDVDGPSDLSKATWKDALLRTKNALKDKDLASSAAALAYYSTLSFFPVLLGSASVYILLTSPASLATLINDLGAILPATLHELLVTVLSPLTSSPKHVAGIATIISVGALLWTTSGGVQNLVRATNKAYEVNEDRGFIKLRLASVLLSIVVLLSGAVIFGLLILQAEALEKLGAPDIIVILFPFLRWPILIILVSLILSTIYRYGPNRSAPHWQWVSWGATAATILWLIATILFFIYVQSFGNYAKTYGVFAGIIVLMIWFNVSALIVLLGAQVNKKLEEVA
ncbi:MAG: ribonuclease [Candidatus Saccharibacteria bacterium]|nr:ribonuclease [Candidatus Saccharibacteria bacterium]